MNTPFSEDLEATRQAAKYDQACKRLLSYKPILAHILKYCVDEFKDSTLYDIEHKYIEGEPEISAEAMHPDQSMRIVGDSTEDPSVNEHESRLLGMLNTLFSDTMTVSDRKQILSNEYGIAMSGSVKEGVDYMCNLSYGVFERGHEQGIEQGQYESGLASLKNIIEGLHITFDAAADLLKLPEADREKYRAALELDK